MIDLMGIINLNEREDTFYGLTNHRPVATVPFGGRYRIIDFVLSSMVNSGIINIGIFTQNKHRSVFDHLRSGKDWDLDRKHDGLFIFPPDNLRNHVYQGDLKSFYQNISYIDKSKQKYALIAGSSVICNINYRPILNYHVESKADITALYTLLNNDADFNNCTFINKMYDGRILDMEINPVRPTSNKVSLDMYIMEKTLLMDLIDACFSRGYYDLVKDGLLKNLSMLKVLGYHYQGYFAKINSLASYYQHSLDLLRPEKRGKLFYKPGLIYTKIKDEPSAKYIKGAKVANSLVANGCIIEGTVENSILFRGVKIDREAVVKNSIIMQMSQIERGALVQNVIADKEVIVTEGKRLVGDMNFPIYIKKKTLV